MYLTLIILPLLGSLASGLLGRKLGTSGSQIITCSSIFITTVLAINAFFEVGFNNTNVSLQLFRWLDLESINIYWEFNFDSLTVSMLIPVLIVSLLVHIYSIGYMNGDPHNQRFFSYLSLFTFMMIILVTANNLLLMFVGWEGVGVCSYLLVSFWYTRIAANQSSLSAFLTNRVGDCFLTIGMFILIWTMGNIDYTTIFSLSPYINENIITLIGICLLIGAMAKSSQIGLHVWLPMAMEGPTPVSALIHAATMVTAGVYLLMRTSPLIEYSSTLLLLCLWIGAITTVFSSLIGLFQQDIKKVIAYSTMSQLGMMVIAIGLSSYNVALFHLINHAFYKGLLFLAAGSVIHAVSDNQDFRKYGGLRAFLPLTYSVMLIASLSLIAFPFMTGFYSKDFILESSYGQFYFSSFVVYYIASIGAIFTTLYSVKVLYLTFLANPNGSLSDYKSAHEGDIYMSLPLIILAIFSIFFGYITRDIFIGLGTSFFQDNSIFIHPNHEITIETEFGVSHIFKILPLINTILFTIVSLSLSEFYPNLLIHFKLSRFGYNIFGFFNQRFLIELFYNKYITNVALKLGGQTTKVLDKGSVEYLGPHGLSVAFINLSKNIGKLDSSVITSYALYILSGLVFYMFINYTKSLDDVLIIIVLYGFLTLTVKSDKLTEILGFSRPPTSNIKKINSSVNIFRLDNKINTIAFLSFNVTFILLIFKYPIKQYWVYIEYYKEYIIYLYLINIIIALFFHIIFLCISYTWIEHNNFKMFLKERLTIFKIFLILISPIIMTLIIHLNFLYNFKSFMPLELFVKIPSVISYIFAIDTSGMLLTYGKDGFRHIKPKPSSGGAPPLGPAPSSGSAYIPEPGSTSSSGSRGKRGPYAKRVISLDNLSKLGDLEIRGSQVNLCVDEQFKEQWMNKYISAKRYFLSKGATDNLASREARAEAHDFILRIKRTISDNEYAIKLRNPHVLNPHISEELKKAREINPFADAFSSKEDWDKINKPRLEGVTEELLKEPKYFDLEVKAKRGVIEKVRLEATGFIKQELISKEQKLIAEQEKLSREEQS